MHGVTGNPQWDPGRSKRSQISTAINTAPPGFIAVVAKATFAHHAFPGVTEAAAKYAAIQHDKKPPPSSVGAVQEPQEEAKVSGALPGPEAGSIAAAVGQGLISQHV